MAVYYVRSPQFSIKLINFVGENNCIGFPFGQTSIRYCSRNKSAGYNIHWYCSECYIVVIVYIGVALMVVIQNNVQAAATWATFNAPDYTTVPNGIQILPCQLDTTGNVRSKGECAYLAEMSSSDAFVYSEEKRTCQMCSQKTTPPVTATASILTSIEAYVKGTASGPVTCFLVAPIGDKSSCCKVAVRKYWKIKILHN